MIPPKEYRYPNHNEIIKLKRYINLMTTASQFFERYFINKVVYYETELDKIAVYFSSTNFMHLCGISYKNGAKKFYKDCLNNQIIIHHMAIKWDGTTFQKLQALGSISEIIGNHVNLTISGKYLYLEFDYALRTKKQILALTLKHANAHKIVPQSLLDLKKQIIFPVGSPVHTIYAERFDTKAKEIYFSLQK